jgi:hypothetical protein
MIRERAAPFPLSHGGEGQGEGLRLLAMAGPPHHPRPFSLTVRFRTSAAPRVGFETPPPVLRFTRKIRNITQNQHLVKLARRLLKGGAGKGLPDAAASEAGTQ